MTAKQKKQSKEFIGKLHEKYYCKEKSKAQKPKAAEKSEVSETSSKGPSRNELMLQAKAKGIKNFRVINKQELVEILKEGIDQERINEIISDAVARWKAGWGKKKQKSKEI